MSLSPLTQAAAQFSFLVPPSPRVEEPGCIWRLRWNLLDSQKTLNLYNRETEGGTSPHQAGPCAQRGSDLSIWLLGLPELGAPLPCGFMVDFPGKWE